MAYVLSADTEVDLQCQEEVMDKLLFPCSGKAGLFWLRTICSQEAVWENTGVQDAFPLGSVLALRSMEW